MKAFTVAILASLLASAAMAGTSGLVANGRYQCGEGVSFQTIQTPRQGLQIRLNDSLSARRNRELSQLSSGAGRVTFERGFLDGYAFYRELQQDRSYLGSFVFADPGAAGGIALIFATSKADTVRLEASRFQDLAGMSVLPNTLCTVVR